MIPMHLSSGAQQVTDVTSPKSLPNQPDDSLDTYQPSLSSSDNVFDNGSDNDDSSSSISKSSSTCSGSICSKHTTFRTFDHLQQDLDILKKASTNAYLVPVVHKLAHTMKSSLADNSSATMLPSLISALPSGRETGTFLSVDVGGSTLRIALIKLFGRSSGINPKVLSSSTHPINRDIKALSGVAFFEWIGNHIKDLLMSQNYLHNHISMGLSWSFPFAQLESVAKGTILKMGKGYLVADEIASRDLKDMFDECFASVGLNISLTAIVNDTVASLLSHAYMNASTRAAVILGTGVNSSALITDNGINKLINTEMSLMGGDKILPQTEWDVLLDSRVEQPGFQPFETMVSGRYLGEVARLVIMEMNLLKRIHLEFDDKSGNDVSLLNVEYGFETALMAEIEDLAVYKNAPVQARRTFEKKLKVHVSLKDFEEIYKVIRHVSTRSASWIGASLVSLALNLNQKGDPLNSITTIAYSGTVIEKYPYFKERCQRVLSHLGNIYGVTGLTLDPALDGTLYGPAIASAMYA
jgi:hexokinase